MKNNIKDSRYRKAFTTVWNSLTPLERATLACDITEITDTEKPMAKGEAAAAFPLGGRYRVELYHSHPMSDKRLQAMIAHELAHVKLKHEGGQGDTDSMEWEALKLQKQWGFTHPEQIESRKAQSAEYYGISGPQPVMTADSLKAEQLKAKATAQIEALKQNKNFRDMTLAQLSELLGKLVMLKEEYSERYPGADVDRASYVINREIKTVSNRIAKLEIAKTYPERR